MSSFVSVGGVTSNKYLDSVFKFCVKNKKMIEVFFGAFFSMGSPFFFFLNRFIQNLKLLLFVFMYNIYLSTIIFAFCVCKDLHLLGVYL